MTKAKIGVQMMMLKDKVEELGIYETLKRVKELGYRSVEISQIPMTETNVAEMKRAIDELGIEIAALSAVVTSDTPSNDALDTDFDKIVQDCKTLNCDLLRIGMLPFANMVSLEKVLEFTRAANDYAKQLAEHGIKLYYHNHHVEFRKYDGELMWDIIARECPDLGFEMDVHWVQRGGVNPVDLLTQYQGRVDLVHLKDYRVGAIPDTAFQALEDGDVGTFYQAFTNIIEFAELGQGSMNFGPIIEAALAAGARYLLVEQDMVYGRDPFDCLKDSRDHLIAIGYEHLF